MQFIMQVKKQIIMYVGVQVFTQYSCHCVGFVQVIRQVLRQVIRLVNGKVNMPIIKQVILHRIM